MRNEILKEVWRTRDALAARHHHDLDAIVAELKEIEKAAELPVVDRSKRTPSANDAGRRRRRCSREPGH